VKYLILSGILVLFFAFHGSIAYCFESKYYNPDMPTEFAVGKKDVSKYRDDKPHPSIINLPASIAELRQNDGEAFLVELVKYIKKETTDPFEQVKMIHDWVALNDEGNVTIDVPMAGEPGIYTVRIFATKKGEKINTSSVFAVGHSVQTWEQPIYDLVSFSIDFKDIE
jgi:hypothetical protein